MSKLLSDKLAKKKVLRILGINSGTSADGVDLALITFARPGKHPKIKFIDGKMIPYPPRIKAELEHLIQDKTIGIEEAGRFDIAYGAYLGRAAARFVQKNRHKVDLIASHGQTIGHYPSKQKTLSRKYGTTIQIGDGNAIASVSGIPVVSDFRRSDIALGGEGAPLTPFVNHLLFGDKRRSRIIVNIGGIANFSYHRAGISTDDVKGGDCGPGNILSDIACRLIFHLKYDRNGRLAAKGTVVDEIVDAIIEANAERGVSAGREQFDHYLLAKLVHKARKQRASNHDFLASIDEATTRLIHRSFARYLKDPHLEGVYITGGGRHNVCMIERLQSLCAPIRVLSVKNLGYDGDFLEAISFAILGGCFLYGIPSTIPHITGGKQGSVAGKLSLPPR